MREATSDETVKRMLANTGTQVGYLDTASFQNFLNSNVEQGRRFAKLRKAAEALPQELGT